MQGGPNPSITATAVGAALGTDQTAAAGARGLAGERAELDKAELRELERAVYYPFEAIAAKPAAQPRRRSIVDRLLRR